MEQGLTVVIGALIGAAITYLLMIRNSKSIKESLYDSKLVNRFLKEYLNKNKPSNQKNGKKKYYKNKRTQKAGATGNKPTQPSK